MPVDLLIHELLLLVNLAHVGCVQQRLVQLGNQDQEVHSPQLVGSSSSFQEVLDDVKGQVWFKLISVLELLTQSLDPKSKVEDVLSREVCWLGDLDALSELLKVGNRDGSQATQEDEPVDDEGVILIFTGFPKKLLTPIVQRVQEELEEVSVVVDIIGVPLGFDASNCKPG